MKISLFQDFVYLLQFLPFKNDLLKKFIEVQLFEPELWLKYKECKLCLIKIHYPAAEKRYLLQ